MNEMKDRIRQIMEAQHMSQQTFANFIGVSTASLSSIFNNRTRPTLNTVEAIKSKIPQLNIEWLMFGHGPMFEDGKDVADENVADNHNGVADSTTDFGGGSGDLFGGQQPPQRQTPPARPSESPVNTVIKYVDRPQRQITEIRVYFDDLTYETFVPKK